MSYIWKLTLRIAFDLRTFIFKDRQHSAFQSGVLSISFFIVPCISGPEIQFWDYLLLICWLLRLYFGIFGYKFERWVPSVTKWIHFRHSIYSWSGEFWWSIFHFILDRQCDCIFDVRIFVVKMNELERKWSWWQTKWANSQKIHFRLDFEPSGLNITTLARQEVISIARSDTVAASGQFRKIVDK